MVLEKSATLLFVWLTPSGVKLCSQVCGELGSTHAWISVFSWFHHGARRRCADCSTNMHGMLAVSHDRRCVPHLRTIRTPTACPILGSEILCSQACGVPPHTWLPNFTPNGVTCGMGLESIEQMLHLVAYTSGFPKPFLFDYKWL